ncbi:ABC transporter ATP-binding protein [Bauldia litoralis]|uniref:Putative spermidine/putrescine transport system ATP-binding protein n=1 Tax=Bauldia litoralis TaxID=665467 RepID=A0A1G6BUQ2_9HYPH|nr:ABC transporter ATP-binding protein [Bauldia litoralis]SDB24297.1 putative spermidine/putrescine transport system ATP-binding protein [Bauldia litoralis]
MTTGTVEVVGVQKRFGDTVALEQVDFTVAAGEFVSLLGASGCGKSTLLRIVAGFESPSSGRVMISGRDITDWPPHRRPTNIVFQQGALFPHLNVFDNIAYSLKLRNWSRTRIAAKVEEMLALVRLDGFATRGPTELSGGQVQRVALARALAAEPSVLLLDEPLSALDQKLRQEMQLELRGIQKRLGATFVFVTHDQTEALVMSDRIAIMDRGKIVQVGTPREIYKRPASIFASSFIGQTNLLPGKTTAVAGTAVTVAVGADDPVEGLAAAPLAIGAAATLSVRPEAVRIATGEAAVGGVPATLSEIVYLGNSIRIGAVIGDGTLVWADLRDEEAAGLEIGDKVRLTWAPDAATVWEGAER